MGVLAWELGVTLTPMEFHCQGLSLHQSIIVPLIHTIFYKVKISKEITPFMLVNTITNYSSENLGTISDVLAIFPARDVMGTLLKRSNTDTSALISA